MAKEHAGMHIAEELRARMWFPEELAWRAIMDKQAVLAILSGSARITPADAESLGLAFGVSAQFFMNMQGAYDRMDKVNREGDSGKDDILGSEKD